MMRKPFLPILFFLIACSLQATGNVDSLYNLIERSDNTEEKVEHYQALIKTLLIKNDSTALDYIEELKMFSKEAQYPLGTAYANKSLGFYYLMSGDFQEAIKTYQISFDEYKAFNDYQGMFDTNNNLGISYERIGQFDQVLEIANKGLSIAEESGDSKLLAKANKRMAQYLGNIKKDVQASLVYLDKASRSAEDSGDEAFLAEILLTKGSVLIGTDNNQAQDVLVRAERLAEKTDQNNLLIYIRKALIYIYHNGNKLSEAIEMVNKNLNMAEEYNDVILVVTSYIQLGDLYNSLKHETKPVEYYERALSIAKESNMIEQITASYVGLGQFYTNHSEHKKAIDYLQKANVLADSLNYVFTKLQILPDLGYACFGANRLEEGKAYFLELIDLAEMHNPPAIGGAKAGLGQYYYRVGDYNTAKPYLEAGYDYGASQNIFPIKSEMASYLADISERNGNFKDALKWTNIVIAEKDSLNLMENQEKMTTLRLSSEFEKEKEILALQQEQEKALLKEKQVRAYTIGGAAIALLLLSLFFYKSLRDKNSQLNSQKQSLEKLNGMKDQIFQIIGHDLKKPAISFRGMAKNIDYLIQKGDTERLSKLGREIDSDASRFFHLTDNLLNWAATQKDLISLNPERIVLRDLVQQNVDLFSSAAEKKGIKLENKVSQELEVEVDKNTLMTIIRNLLDNAIKFTETDGTVQVQDKTAKGYLSLEVVDSGRGLDKAKIDAILSRDFILSEDGTGSEKGSGLGLSIVKNLVEKLNGNLQIDSVPGQGSRFQVLIPV